VTFDQLYGIELDRELGTADTSQRFTTTRRKAAINAGQLEFVKRTECFTRQTTVTLADDTQEYDLEATITDFAWVSKQGLSIKIVDASGNTRYLEGDDLQETSVEALQTNEPGWRAVSKGTPQYWYLRRDGGTLNVGLYPKPTITTDTWTLIVPYVVVPTDLNADSDEPFSISGNAIRSMRPWHRALVYFAAFDLEKLRKDVSRQQSALQLFELEVQKYLASMKPRNGQRVRFAKNYRAMQRASGLTPRRYDPRAYP
jgi:hypothetical protein